MIGTIVEIDILNFLKETYDFEIYKSDVESDKNEIDAFINGRKASIKSIKYRNSAYSRVASKDISDVLDGAPIIYYKVTDDSYKIDNLSEVVEYYKNNKKDLDISTYNKVKHLRI